MEDKRNILANEKPFSYKLLKDEKAQVSFHGKTVKVLHGTEYTKLLKVIQGDDEYAVQLFLAKITGNFKRGNYRTDTGLWPKQSRRDNS